MIGSTNGHRVDILAVEQASVVLIDFELSAQAVLKEASVTEVHIGNGHHVAQCGGLQGNLHPTPGMLPFPRISVDIDARPDGAHIQPIVGRALSCRAAPKQRSGERSAADCAHEFAAICLTWCGEIHAYHL